MKLLFSLSLFVSLSSQAQDSCKLKQETDPFTHQTRITTGFVSFVNNGVPLFISVDATKTEIDFFFWIKDDSKCFDETATAQVNYEGERLKANYKNSGSMNCEGAFHFTFRNSPSTPSALKRLTDKKINTIKLTGNNKTSTDISFTEEQKIKLMQMAACVVTQAKALSGK